MESRDAFAQLAAMEQELIAEYKGRFASTASEKPQKPKDAEKPAEPRKQSPSERPEVLVKPREARVTETKETLEPQEFTGNLEALELIAKDNLTKFKDYVKEIYQVDEERLHEALGERIYALLEGQIEEYMRLVIKGVPGGGEERVINGMIKNHVPELKKWLLESYELSEEQLKDIFGQAFVDLGFDRVPEMPVQKEEKPEPLPEVVTEIKESPEPPVKEIEKPESETAESPKIEIQPEREIEPKENIVIEQSPKVEKPVEVKEEKKQEPEIKAAPPKVEQEKKPQQEVIDKLELRAILSELLKEHVKEIKNLKIDGTADELEIDINLDAGLVGGDVHIVGELGNSGTDIAVKNYDIDARKLTKWKLESKLHEVSQQVRAFAEKKYGRPIAKINVKEGKLVIEFKE